MALNRQSPRHDHDIQIFSAEEMQRRHDNLVAWMRKGDVDAALVHTADNVYYLSGVPLLSPWGRPLWYVITASGESALIGSGIELENMQSSFLDEALWYADEKHVEEAALDLALKFLGSRNNTLAVEASLLTERQREGIESRFPSVARQIEIGDQLADWRLIKSSEELELLELAGEVAKIGANAFLEEFREGVTELHVTSAAVSAMNIATAALAPVGLSSSYSYCQVGLRTLTPHLHAGGRRVRKGDVVGLNVFPTISGYCVELERTFVYGEPTKQQDDALRAVTDAFTMAKGLVAPGVIAGDIDTAARNRLIELGYGNNLRHGTGHAHGIMIGQTSREEFGELREYNRHVIRNGIACSVEPGIFIPEVGGFRHSDVMIVRNDVAECITEFDVLLDM